MCRWPLITLVQCLSDNGIGKQTYLKIKLTKVLVALFHWCFVVQSKDVEPVIYP